MMVPPTPQPPPPTAVLMMPRSTAHISAVPPTPITDAAPPLEVGRYLFYSY
eukprot:CAMPEP_0178634304 /NCGR_PEP_ID=MMETSP0698-20121128/12549_1 /TAXON_ID=265572 /ORGANISM="Extubocellulus spinifer, Strain CCMP396" /LENGTH=50 /DNA_ID=CAMNT_0020273943 /DNA_START=14 /DNA_END=169 /DNA_ORIENTATION=+